MLNQLPSPPPGKTGWPWTEESEHLPPLLPEGRQWPRISIITPSFNHGRFIEETIRSIILQSYPNLEYIIIDGGSTDNTLETIRKYDPWITFWESETDSGQSQAINKGFKKSTGKLVNWISSDDMLCKNALYNSAGILTNNLNALFIGKGLRIDQSSKIIDEIGPSSIQNIKDLLDIKNYWRKCESIMQQSCFYPLDEVRNSGYLNENNHYTMDYEFWGRLLINGIPVVQGDSRVGVFRWYKGQKTSNFNTVTNSLIKTALSLIHRNNKFSVFVKIRFRMLILAYGGFYYYHELRSQIGVKRRLKSLMNAGSDNLYK